MMKLTENLELKKPDLTDYVNVADFNENFDTIDLEFTGLQEGYNNRMKLFSGSVEPVEAKTGDYWLREVWVK